MFLPLFLNFFLLQPPHVPRDDGSVAKSSQSTIPASCSTTNRQDTTYETHRLVAPAARTQSPNSQNGKLQQPEDSGVLDVRQGDSSSGQLTTEDSGVLDVRQGDSSSGQLTTMLKIRA